MIKGWVNSGIPEFDVIASTLYASSNSLVELYVNNNNSYQVSIFVDKDLLFVSLPFEKLEGADKMYLEIVKWADKQFKITKRKWVNYLNKLTERWDDKLSFKQHVGFVYQT